MSNSHGPKDCILSGSSVHEILQVRILEWVATSFSRVSSQESNPGLLLCRNIFYQLSYKRRPCKILPSLNVQLKMKHKMLEYTKYNACFLFIKLDIKAICKSVKYCYSHSFFLVLENIVIFHKNLLFMLTCNEFIFIQNEYLSMFSFNF